MTIPTWGWTYIMWTMWTTMLALKKTLLLSHAFYSTDRMIAACIAVSNLMAVVGFVMWRVRRVRAVLWPFMSVAGFLHVVAICGVITDEYPIGTFACSYLVSGGLFVAAGAAIACVK